MKNHPFILDEPNPKEQNESQIAKRDRKQAKWDMLVNFWYIWAQWFKVTAGILYNYCTYLGPYSDPVKKWSK